MSFFHLNETLVYQHIEWIASARLEGTSLDSRGVETDDHNGPVVVPNVEVLILPTIHSTHKKSTGEEHPHNGIHWSLDSSASHVHVNSDSGTETKFKVALTKIHLPPAGKAGGSKEFRFISSFIYNVNKCEEAELSYKHL